MVRLGRGILPLAIKFVKVRPISAIKAGPEAQLAPGFVPAVAWHTNCTYTRQICRCPSMSARRFWASPLKVFAWISAHTFVPPLAAKAASCSAA